MRESEDKYRGVAEASPDAIVMSDLNGRVLFASRQTWSLLGLADSDELVGRSVFDYVIEADRKRLAGNLSNLLELGVRRSTEYTFIRKDGSTVPVEASSVVIRDAAGQPKAVMAVLRDITERKQAEQKRLQAQELLKESETRYRELIDNQGEGLGIVDREERFTLANPAGEQIFGVPRGSLAGRSLREFVTQDQYARVLEQTKKRQAGEKNTYELEIVRPSGETRCLLVTVVPRNDREGRFVESFGLFFDITERKRAEEALERERQSLWRMLQASDHERQTISYEIHDGLAQYLAAAVMQFQVFDGLRESNPEEAKKAYDAAVQLVSQSHSEARRLISEVSPARHRRDRT